MAQRIKYFVILGHFLPFYLEKLKKTPGDIIILHRLIYHKWRSYDVWFLIYGAQQTGCFVILGQFLPFGPLHNLQNQNFKKMKKTPWDIIILRMCTKNHGHRMYGSWGMVREQMTGRQTERRTDENSDI